MHNKVKRVLKGSVLPRRPFIEVQRQTEAGKENQVPGNRDPVPGEAVRNQELLEDRLRLRCIGQRQHSTLDPAAGADPVGEEGDIRRGDVVPEVGVVGVERDAVERELYSLKFACRVPRTTLEPPPLLAVARGHQRVVVLHELPETDQDLAVVEDLLDLAGDPPRLRRIVHPADLPAPEFDRRPLDRVHRHDPRRLPGPLDLHLGPDREEIAEDVHRRGV